MELMVAMFIASIGLVAGWKAHGIIVRQFLSYKTSTEQWNDALVLDALLQQDFEQAHKIFGDAGQIRFFRNERPFSTYDFSNPFVVRQQGHKLDTFHVKPTEIHSFWQGATPTASQPVETLQLTLEVDQKELEHRYTHWYDAAQLMNMEEQDGH